MFEFEYVVRVSYTIINGSEFWLVKAQSIKVFPVLYLQ